MERRDVMANALARSLQLIERTLADFSDDQMLTRPAPGANHAAWQLGHLIASETRMVNAVKPGAAAELPAGFMEKFTPETAKLDDPTAFPKKAELLTQAAKTREATVRWARTLSEQEMSQATPERLQRFASDVGDLVASIPAHVAMHVGQMQVIRRKLGKPILF